jgi:hypothetical protein
MGPPNVQVGTLAPCLSADLIHAINRKSAYIDDYPPRSSFTRAGLAAAYLRSLLLASLDRRLLRGESDILDIL